MNDARHLHPVDDEVPAIHNVAYGLLASTPITARLVEELEQRDDLIANRLYDALTSADLAPDDGKTLVRIIHAAFGHPNETPDEPDFVRLAREAAAAGEEARKAHDRWRVAWRKVTEAAEKQNP